MSRTLLLAGSLALLGAVSILPAQDVGGANTPKKSLQPSEAQPKKGSAPPLRPLVPPSRPAQLTDPATDEDGRPLLPTRLDTEEGPQAAPRRRDPDRVMATWIALDSQEGIAVADLAAQRATNSDVREFAKMLADDHAAFLASLKAFTPEGTAANYLNTTAKDARDIEPPIRKTESGPPIPAEPGTLEDKGPLPKSGRSPSAKSDVNRDFNIVQIERELATQSLASSRKMLNERRGVEFDRHFLGTEIAMHKTLRDKLIVYQRHVSAPLAKIFADGEHACDEHLAKALELMRTLSPTPVAATPPRPAATATRSVRSAVTDKR